MIMDSKDYKNIFLKDIPLFDVRAPIEFNKGAFPKAINLPLMNDVERQKVGTCYKQQGQQAAINLGHKLVSGTIKEERIAAWVNFAKQHPEGYLYCFRGGLRSRTSQQWLKSEAGIDYPFIQGGYKAMRNFLIDTIENTVKEKAFLIVGGMTGTGKTDVLLQFENSIDLEQHAHHRGSSFGKHAEPQSTQINFENSLAIDLLKKNQSGKRNLFIEDEGRAIGSCSVPLNLYKRMSQSPIIWLEDSLENRVERILRDYVIRLSEEFTDLYGEQEGFKRFASRLQESLARITKRLGGERFQRIASLMDVALIEHQQTNNVALHQDWITVLLTEYYDPMYEYQSKKKTERIIVRGNQQALIEYLEDITN